MLCSAARRSRRWSQLSATGGKVQERKAKCISLYSLSHSKMGFDIIYTIVREKKDNASKVQDEEKNKNKIQALTLPSFQNLPASGKYACCEERKKKKKRKKSFSYCFLKPPQGSSLHKIAFSQLLQEIEAVLLKSNQHLSIKNL